MLFVSVLFIFYLTSILKRTQLCILYQSSATLKSAHQVKWSFFGSYVNVLYKVDLNTFYEVKIETNPFKKDFTVIVLKLRFIRHRLFTTEKLTMNISV